MRIFKGLKKLLVVVFVLASLAACGGGGGGGAAGDVTAPDFDGVVLSYSSASDTINLHWPVAVDAITNSTDIDYKVYRGIANDVSGAALVNTVTGSTTFTDTGLINDTGYWYYVVAADTSGNISTAPQSMTEVRTMPADVALHSQYKTLSGTVTADPVVTDRYQVDTTNLSVGDVVIIEAAASNTIRRITAINGNTIDTTDGALGDIIKGGVINSTIEFPDIPAGGTLTASWAGGNKVEAYNDPGGAFSVSTVTYADVPAERSALSESEIDAYDNVKTLYSGAGRVKMGYSMNFEPRLLSVVQFDEGLIVDTLSFARVQAVGTLSLDAMMGYYLTGSASYSNTETLMTKTFSTNYFIGTMPVQQDVIIDLKADISFTADAKLAVEGKMVASKTVGIGFVWDRASGTYRMVSNDNFTKEITFQVLTEGGLTATVKVYPVISTRFYKTATVSMNIEPSIGVAASARLTPLPVELTQFDVDFNVDLSVGAQLKIFKLSLLDWNSAPTNIFNASIFSLPTLDAVTCGTTSLDIDEFTNCTVTWTDGTNNGLDISSLRWEEFGTSGNMSLSAISGTDTTTVTSTAITNGVYDLMVSAYGDGFLGELGRRYFTVPFTLVNTNPAPAGAGTYTGPMNFNDGNGYDWAMTMSVTLNANGTATATVAGGTITDASGSDAFADFIMTGTWSGSTFSVSGSFTAMGEPLSMSYGGTFSNTATSGTIDINHTQFGPYASIAGQTLPKVQ